MNNSRVGEKRGGWFFKANHAAGVWLQNIINARADDQQLEVAN